MTVYLDDAIFKLQAHGGISTLWNKITPHFEAALEAVTWGENADDYFMSTYYATPPDGLKSIAVCYDFLAERYKPIGAHHPDAVAKQHAIQAAEGVITISEWVASDARQFTDKPVYVAHCGTDMQRAEPADVNRFRDVYHLYTPYVLVMGKRHLYKNVSALYQAWQYWQGRDTHTLVCIGGEDTQIADEQFAKAFPGQWWHLRLEDSDIPAAYTGAAMLVYPSLYEGFGLPVLEAMACGTPVVCGQRSAIPEFASDTPYYTDVFRPMSIATSMTQSLQTDARRLLDGQSRAREMTWQRMAQQMVKAIEDITTHE